MSKCYLFLILLLSFCFLGCNNELTIKSSNEQILHLCYEWAEYKEAVTIIYMKNKGVSRETATKEIQDFLDTNWPQFRTILLQSIKKGQN